MISSFFGTKKWSLWAWGGGFLLASSLWIQVRFTVAINSWYGRFYNLLQKSGEYKDNPQVGIKQFYDHLISIDYIHTEADPSFLVLAMPYILLSVLTGWFTRIYGLRWREAMTFSFIPRWEKIQEDIEGSSQRIQEDCNRFARIVESLGLQIVRALMTLIAFIPVLWELSRHVTVPYIQNFDGSMVYIALFVSIGGLAISWFVGWKLPGLEYNNQKIEAAFRKELVLGEDDKTRYTGSDDLFSLFLGIRINYQRLYKHYSYFDAWASSYDQMMVIVPYLIVGPGLFTGAILLGTVTQVSNAFARVHGGFALFLHNWTTITELRSIWKRLHEFEANLKKHGA